LITLGGVVCGKRVAVVQGYRYPVGVISHCVWLCSRFPSSFREVEEGPGVLAQSRVAGGTLTLRPSQNRA
jgi:hypothetical protein